MIDLSLTDLHYKKFLFHTFNRFFFQRFISDISIGISKTDVFFLYLRKTCNFQVKNLLPMLKALRCMLKFIKSRYLFELFRRVNVFHISLTKHIEDHFVGFVDQFVKVFIFVEHITTFVYNTSYVVDFAV